MERKLQRFFAVSILLMALMTGGALAASAAPAAPNCPNGHTARSMMNYYNPNARQHQYLYICSESICEYFFVPYGGAWEDHIYAGSSSGSGTSEVCKECKYRKAAHQHDVQNVNWSWSGTTATVSGKCSECQQSDSQTAVVSQTGHKEATCNDAETYTYTATATLLGKQVTDTRTVNGIPALGHSLSASWNGTTAAVTCVRGDITKTVTGHKVQEAGTRAATCTDPGWDAYHYEASYLGENFTSQSYGYLIPAAGHDYEAPVWHWNGLSSAYATFECKNCDEVYTSATANSTSTITRNPTCQVEGNRLYTVVTDGPNGSVSDSKNEAIEKIEHSYHSAPTFTWNFVSEDAASATAVYACDYGCNTPKNVTATVTRIRYTAPTCTQNGSYEWTASVGSYSDTQSGTLPAAGHDYEEPVWHWNGLSSAYATFECKNCDEVYTSATANSTSTITRNPTCQVEGNRLYTVITDGPNGSVSDSKNEAIEKIEHSYHSAPTFTWNFVSEDAASATAVYACDYGCNTPKNVTATVTRTQYTAPTCTQNGSYEWTASVGSYSDTQSGTLPAAGHDYEAPVWHWNGLSSAYATFECKNCDEVYASSDASITENVTQEPTCEQDGSKQVTAIADGPLGAVSDTKTAPIEKLNHDYGNKDNTNVTFVFSEDGKTAAAVIRCVRAGCTHTYTEDAVVASAETKPASCTEMGDTTYTAVYENASAQKTVTDIPVLGHAFTNYVSNNDATCTQDGTKTAKCDRCDVTDTVADAGSALGHKFTHYVSNNDATCTEDGTETAVCDRCDATDTMTEEDTAGCQLHKLVLDADGTSVEIQLCPVCGKVNGTPALHEVTATTGNVEKVLYRLIVRAGKLEDGSSILTIGFLNDSGRLVQTLGSKEIRISLSQLKELLGEESIHALTRIDPDTGAQSAAAFRVEGSELVVNAQFGNKTVCMMRVN